MKSVVLIGGGMADESLELLGNRSPLEAADVPNLDRIAAEGRTGLIRTVPPGREPAAESAAASLLGLDAPPGGLARGPLEALGIGIPPEKDQLALRF
ncbi:MAG: phosphoglycerate mutase, partial [Nitrospinota bacterium]|nr:phosphoglycerate mutase [Nitrospinota bacterium]